MKNTNRTLLFILLSSLVIVLTAYFIFWKPSTKTYLGYKPLPFSKQSWAQADIERRGYMVGDLLEMHKLHGKIQEEVLDILGEPDSISKSETANKRKTFYYKLGYMGFNPKASMVLDYALRVRFKDGLVEDVYVDD